MDWDYEIHTDRGGQNEEIVNTLPRLFVPGHFQAVTASLRWGGGRGGRALLDTEGRRWCLLHLSSSGPARLPPRAGDSRNAVILAQMSSMRPDQVKHFRGLGLSSLTPGLMRPVIFKLVQEAAGFQVRERGYENLSSLSSQMPGTVDTRDTSCVTL